MAFLILRSEGTLNQNVVTNKYDAFFAMAKLLKTDAFRQRSLVILSQHAYPSLFYTLVAYLGQEFLLHGGPMLEVGCHNIASW